ncbi:MAG: hypothetical protein Q8P67_18825 [archaeon]|nr:hypothetical protein [archaeon]
MHPHPFSSLASLPHPASCYSSLPKLSRDLPNPEKNLRRSTGGPYTRQDPEESDNSEEEASEPPDDIPSPLISSSLISSSVFAHENAESIVIAAVAPYDSFDPELDEYCRLPSSNRHSNRIPSPLVPPLAQPFSSSNSPLASTSTTSVPYALLIQPAAKSSSPISPAFSSTPVHRPLTPGFVATPLALDPSQEGRQATTVFQETGLATKQLIQEYFATIDSQDEQRAITRENRARLIFLTDTIDLILQYLNRQREETLSVRAYVAILNATRDQMCQTQEMITRIVRKRATMTPNFDIFELTLRRYQGQLAQMFPAQGESSAVIHSPSTLIIDLEARAIWEQAFGHYCYFVSFDTFIQDIVDKQIFRDRLPANAHIFKQFLRYFLNFPVDDMVTTYKWNTLTRLFGPYREFATNFSTYALTQGFLGLTNRINAYEILTLKHTRRVLVIRLSRTEPEYLAFSYKNSKGEIGHQVNKDKSGQPIPIGVFLKQRFPGYERVDEKLDIVAILGKTNSSTLCDYADGSYGYIH